MRYLVNKLVTENEKTVGYRINTQDVKYDLGIGLTKKLFSVVGKRKFRSGEDVYVTDIGGIYCSDNEDGVVECTDWFGLASKLTAGELGSEVSSGVQNIDTSDLEGYTKYDGVKKIITDIQSEMNGCYGSATAYLDRDKYDSVVKVDYHFLRFIDLARFIVNYVRCNWEMLAPKVGLEIKVNGSISRCIVTSNTTVEEVVLTFAKLSDNVLYSDSIKQMLENYEVVVKLLSRRNDALGSVVEIDEGVSGDLVVTDFKKCDIPGYLNE